MLFGGLGPRPSYIHGGVQPSQHTPNNNPKPPNIKGEEDEDRRDEEESRARKRQRNPEGKDRAQEQAGSLERFKRLLVGKMPGGWVSNVSCLYVDWGCGDVGVVVVGVVDV